VRENRWKPEKFLVRVTMLASEESDGMYDEHERWHDAREERLYLQCETGPEGFWGLTLNGSARLEELVHFYGLKVPDVKPGTTLAGYLAGYGNGEIRPGYRAAVDGADLLVLEAENGTARRVGLELRPRRRHTPRQRRS
jgi:hypothetical protein